MNVELFWLNLKVQPSLKKRFARGSYGNVLLAFHGGNCQEVFSSEGENVNVPCNSSLKVFIARNYGCSSNISQAYSLRLSCSS